MLPVFLAGCRSVLALVGDTYISRLWCVMELFVFCVTGGEEDQIVWRPLDTGGTSSVRIGDFDVRDARCFLESDTDRLLTTIEASFHGLDRFNDTLRKLLERASERSHLISNRNPVMMGRASAEAAAVRTEDGS